MEHDKSLIIESINLQNYCLLECLYKSSLILLLAVQRPLTGCHPLQQAIAPLIQLDIRPDWVNVELPAVVECSSLLATATATATATAPVTAKVIYSYGHG